MDSPVILGLPVLDQAINIGERGPVIPFGGIEFIRERGQRELTLKNIKLFGWNRDLERSNGCHAYPELVAPQPKDK